MNPMRILCNLIILFSLLLMVPNKTSAQSLDVCKIETAGVPRAADVPALLDSCGIATHKLCFSNWEAFPYLPDVTFRMAHTGRAILMHFSVDEQAARAEIGKDNDPVYFDSCVEFFAQLAPDSEYYYNFETNCIGRMLVMRGVSQNERTYAPEATLECIGRWSSLGSEPFGLIEKPTHWELALVIPVEAFFLDSVTDLSGMTIRGNVYKCGDKLPEPHYSAWAPIHTPRPLFHVPAAFAPIYFEE